MKRVYAVSALGLASLGVYLWVGLGGGLEGPAAALGLASPFSAYVALAAALFVLYGAALAILRRMESSAGSVVLIVVLAALFRVALVASPPELSNDMYRYIWDGRVQSQGIAPWAYPPEDPALAGLRDSRIYPLINRKGARTIYPPVAQLFFRGIYALVPDSVDGTKAVIVMADLVTVGLLVWLLALMGVPLQRVAIYAWNPLVVFEVAQSGHLDPLYLPLLVGAFVAHLRGRRALVGALLGLATLTKLYPALLVPAFFRRGERRMPLAWAGVVALGYLPFLWLGSRVLGFLPTYLFDRYEEFNQGVRFAARTVFGEGGSFEMTYLAVTSLALAGLALYVALKDEASPSRVARGGLVLGGFYLFFVSPALHPWYLLWLLAIGVLSPSVTLVAASFALTLSYLKYAREPEVLPLGVRVAEFLPLFALLAWEVLLSGRRRLGGWGLGMRPLEESLPALGPAEYGESKP